MYKTVEIEKSTSKLKVSILLLFLPKKLTGKDRLLIKCTYVVSTTTNYGVPETTRLFFLLTAYHHASLSLHHPTVAYHNELFFD